MMRKLIFISPGAGDSLQVPDADSCSTAPNAAACLQARDNAPEEDAQNVKTLEGRLILSWGGVPCQTPFPKAPPGHKVTQASRPVP